MYDPEAVCDRVTSAAYKAVMYEVSASPKPGLVDRHNSGAHRDMDYFTFIDSCSAIVPYFRKMAMEGATYRHSDLTQLFSSIRSIGMAAEESMFTATKGINTHKGIIFSVGILSALSAYVMTREKTMTVPAEVLCGMVPHMVGDLTQELTKLDEKNILTHGEALYLKHGFKGIRGEVELGFPTVMKRGIPVLRQHIGQGTTNDVLVTALLSLMVHTDDSNILYRHDLETLEDVKEEAEKVYEMGGMMTEAGRQAVTDMDQSFIRRNISPGGSADLLAVTVILGLMEGMKL